ncbi:TrbG/VirB9 family P-type conjugative transfer protein [Caballeronia sp. LP006]|uniref:TrbG/VirB9 family P-type conjugative transfer protein n=1 Tax=Caballeronia sp. LP006 TaxID=3038552 RepID=UPI00285A3CD3|nr:TrbG/VirB9 family P-type conjugative transfer protein [Caballeronia sp. LP006]MDR5832392.1 TrbG/VirB9 family P-type conjugative transfer protein [Caballeronia sp. LP006]
MKHTLSLLTIALAAVALNAAAAGTDPLDFDYEIAGNVLERPALVFNDGSDTYFQPRAGQVLRVDGGHSQGPYIVVPGTPEVIRYSAGGSSATAYWKKANRFIGDKARTETPAGFSGFSGRLALIGPRSSLESTRPLNATLPLAQLVKAVVPQGWTGSAQKDIDLTASTSFGTRDGENWMQSLDRLVAASDLYADVDFNSHHVTLRRSAPQSVAVNYVAPVSQVAAAPAPASSANAAADPIADIAKKSDADAPAASSSVLAAKLGAVAIRDGDDSHIQIKFSAKPAAELKVIGQDGKSLRPKWDDATDVVTFNRAERFTVSNGTNKVEVARVAGTVYEFDTANKAVLQSVFDQDGSTFFKFADTVGKVTVADVAHMGSGEQKGRYYKFNGTADQFIVNADGNVVNVQRKHDVRFFDRPAS